jgi:hypothetical protein
MSRHVFVETNWVVAYASPAHHKVPAAIDLLNRAKAGEFALHTPLPCLTEARRPILTKCQPRREADAIRDFLVWAGSTGKISPDIIQMTRSVLDQFEMYVRGEIKALDTILAQLKDEPGVDVFALNNRMLHQCTELALSDLSLQPFDQAILAAILVRANELWAEGERDLAFAELDGDLQPWDRDGNPKRQLVELYDAAHIWVYGDFELLTPERPSDWQTGTAD